MDPYCRGLFGPIADLPTYGLAWEICIVQEIFAWYQRMWPALTSSSSMPSIQNVNACVRTRTEGFDTCYPPS